jgi:hypothetical protein
VLSAPPTQRRAVVGTTAEKTTSPAEPAIRRQPVSAGARQQMGPEALPSTGVGLGPLIAWSGFLIGSGLLLSILTFRRQDQKLHLLISMRIPVEGRPDERRSIPVLERTIDVKVDPGYSLRGFWSKNWQWLLGLLATVLLGGTGLVWRSKRGQRTTG